MPIRRRLWPKSVRCVGVGCTRNMRAVPYRGRMFVGADVGGTFTDFVGFRGGEVITTKLPSSRDPSAAVLAGMRGLVATELAHGSSLAPHAILHTPTTPPAPPPPLRPARPPFPPRPPAAPVLRRPGAGRFERPDSQAFDGPGGTPHRG